MVLTKIYADGAHLKIALADTRLDEINRARTVKTVYGVLENDAYLSLCIRTFAPKNPKQAARILLKISLYWLIYLKKPRYMVTDNAVGLCKKLGKSGMAGFVNAFLRSFREEEVHLPAGDEGLSVKYNFPLFAVKRLEERYGDRTERILAAKSRGVTVRFVRGEEDYLSRPHENTPFPHTFIFPNFTRDDRFFQGDYTFQSVGSIAICSVVEACEDLFDACAAPGGKSVLLSDKCKRITACELHEHRTELIRQYCSRMKVENVTAVCTDSACFHAEWEEKFDGVLCDVPCSGLGTVAENPDLALRKTAKDIEGLHVVQRAILENCARYAKSGGYVYYATCSLLQEENDMIVGEFLSAQREFECVAAECPLAHETTRYGIQFLPDTAFGAGFYVSKLRRI